MGIMRWKFEKPQRGMGPRLTSMRHEMMLRQHPANISQIDDRGMPLGGPFRQLRQGANDLAMQTKQLGPREAEQFRQ